MPGVGPGGFKQNSIASCCLLNLTSCYDAFPGSIPTASVHPGSHSGVPARDPVAGAPGVGLSPLGTASVGGQSNQSFHSASSGAEPASKRNRVDSDA